MKRILLVFYFFNTPSRSHRMNELVDHNIFLNTIFKDINKKTIIHYYSFDYV